MKNLNEDNIKLENLSSIELNEINGGDGLTEAFFWACGYIASKVHQGNSSMSYRNTRNIYPAGMCFQFNFRDCKLAEI